MALVRTAPCSLESARTSGTITAGSAACPRASAAWSRTSSEPSSTLRTHRPSIASPGNCRPSPRAAAARRPFTGEASAAR